MIFFYFVGFSFFLSATYLLEIFMSWRRGVGEHKEIFINFYFEIFPIATLLPLPPTNSSSKRKHCQVKFIFPTFVWSLKVDSLRLLTCFLHHPQSRIARASSQFRTENIIVNFSLSLLSPFVPLLMPFRLMGGHGPTAKM